MATPTRTKKRFGEFMRALRERSGLSADEVTARLKGKGPMVSRYETGDVKPAWGSVLMMLDLYQAAAGEKARAEELWDEVNEEPPSVRLPTGANRAYRKLVNAERDAVREREMGSLTLPGLLQTRCYMQALIAAGRSLHRSTEKSERLVKVREERQARLTDQANPLRLEAVLDEAVLRRKVGGLDVLREQLDHLLDVAKQPNIDLRVVPFEVGAYGTMNGSCLIVDYPEPDAVSGVYLEYPAGGAWVDNREDVQRFTSMFDEVVSLALSPADTINLIDDQIRALKEP